MHYTFNPKASILLTHVPLLSTKFSHSEMQELHGPFLFIIVEIVPFNAAKYTFSFFFLSKAYPSFMCGGW